MPAIDSTPLIVGDDDHAVVEPVDLAVERQNLFAILGAPHHEIAMHFFGVEDMQRPCAVEGEIIGDINERVDRPQTDRLQALLQPLWARTVLDTAHEA